MDRHLTLAAMLTDARAERDRLDREIVALETALACYEPEPETKPEPPRRRTRRGDVLLPPPDEVEAMREREAERAKRQAERRGEVADAR